jgi:NADPH:quinone reductase-like Zn-dependent oxidoreductase
MKAIVVTDQAAGTAGMKLVERAGPQPSINDVVVQVYASGFVNTELGWPTECQGCHVPAKASDWIYVNGYPALRR